MELSELKIAGRGFGWLAVYMPTADGSDGTVHFETMRSDRTLVQVETYFFFKLYLDPSEDTHSSDIHDIASMVLDYADVAVTTVNDVSGRLDDTSPSAVVFAVGSPQGRVQALEEVLASVGPLEHRILAAELVLRENPDLKL